MRSYAIVEAPSMLGTFPKFGGVRHAPEALLRFGLADAIGGRRAGRVEPPDYVVGRDPATRVTNAAGLRQYALSLAEAVGDVIVRGGFPVVLGGDCSILLGTMLAVGRGGRTGLAFVDGHIDFYPPETDEWDGVGAASELAFAAGRGPARLTDYGLGRPLVRDDDLAVVGFRDQANQRKYGRSLPSASLAISRDDVRHTGASDAAARVLAHLDRPDVPGGFFVHVDADSIDGTLMPAVDDPSPDGFTWTEWVDLLRPIVRHERAVGMQLTIYDPTADPGETAGRALVKALAAVL